MPPASLRRRLTGSSRRALLDAARAQFTEHGYRGTSLDAVVAAADLTKGALYHHFSGKQAVFEAVFAQVEADATQTVRDAVDGVEDPWEAALAGLRAFLVVVRQPAYQRVVMQEGPATLGHERFREQEERSSYALVREVVGRVLEVSGDDLDDAMRETFSRIIFGAVQAAGEDVSTAPDPAAAVRRVEAAIGFLLAGVRQLADQGVTLTDPCQPD
ncbi:TetR family transcriptional regulator [Marmoricola sp. Leaf446]|uniref:TetR/AcrR family transcriptional regulator n=1 Tax=Marmoricola sp. Leaf446 TaxID=1736379 RepID=UPI000700B971|nr:TetR/AcrR family transcriptional regulator [Marmoricola sp. Leaf446]KQT89600.1 TetR family transcriptional regulator [Marmoricola sp. Leaf446]